jgi:hypothetical protein
MTLSTATPSILTDPGFLLIAPLGSTVPSNTVAGSVFTDSWDVAWLSLGATEDGSELSYASTVAPINVAEFYDPISLRTTERHGTIAFSLANWTLTNYRRALNGGTAALTATSGSGATALYNMSPPTPGSEVRAMIGWESLDHTVRFVGYQCFSGGEIRTAFKKAPAVAAIPCTFNFEIPSSGKPFDIWGAGATRV